MIVKARFALSLFSRRAQDEVNHEKRSKQEQVSPRGLFSEQYHALNKKHYLDARSWRVKIKIH